MTQLRAFVCVCVCGWVYVHVWFSIPYLCHLYEHKLTVLQWIYPWLCVFVCVCVYTYSTHFSVSLETWRTAECVNNSHCALSACNCFFNPGCLLCHLTLIIAAVFDVLLNLSCRKPAGYSPPWCVWKTLWSKDIYSFKHKLLHSVVFRWQMMK